MKVRPEVEEDGEITIERCPSCGCPATRLLVAQEARCTLVGWCCDSPTCEGISAQNYAIGPWYREFNRVVGETESSGGVTWIVFTDRWGTERREQIEPRFDVPPPSDDPRKADPRLARAPLPWVLNRDDGDHVIVCRDEPTEVGRLPPFEGADEVASYLVEAANEYPALVARERVGDGWHLTEGADVRPPIVKTLLPPEGVTVCVVDGFDAAVRLGRWRARPGSWGSWEVLRDGDDRFRNDCHVLAWRPLDLPPLPKGMIDTAYAREGSGP